jgi:hypothetical protein
MTYVAIESDPNLGGFASGASPAANVTGTVTTASTAPSATHTSGGAALLRLPVGLTAAGVVAWGLCLL